VALLGLLGVWGCQKELAFKDPSVLETQGKSGRYAQITVEEARSAFEAKYGKVHTIKSNSNAESFNSAANGGNDLVIAPLWTQTQVASYMQTNPLLLVAIQNVPELDTVQSGYSLVFYRDSTGAVKQKLQVYMPEPNYAATHRKFTNRDFTGVFYQIAMSGASGNALKIENGHFKARIVESNSLKLREDCPDPSQCSSFGTGWWAKFKGWVAHIFEGSGGSDYTPAEVLAIPGMLDWSYTIANNPVSGGNPGTHVHWLPDEIGNEIFDMDEDRARLFFIHNKLRLDYGETQFLRNNKCSAVQLEQFLINNTASAANIALARVQLGYL
jgi:hypothetical protein